jgi:Bacterial PH domain
MKDFKEFTFGWIILVFLIPAHLVLTYLHINELGNSPMGTNVYIAVTAIFILIYFLFYGMTTKITSDSITVSFGIGLIRKKIPLARIKSVEAVKSPWYYGWGIRIIPNGMLYNMSGNNGVELKFNDTNSIIRIGTKDSLAFKKEIEKRLRSGTT